MGGRDAGTGAGGSANATSGSGGADAGLPCDVADALVVCVACHSNPPIAGAPAPLVAYADLTAPSKTDPSKTMAQMAVIRMQDAAHPMPPKPVPSATAAQIKTISDWVATGTPMGPCGSATSTPDPTFTGPSVCVSGQFWTEINGQLNGPHPGEPCIGCHAMAQGAADVFILAGTVFPTGHVPDDCLPTPAQSADLTKVTVVITDSSNQVFSLAVSPNGDFTYWDSELPMVAFPFTAKVVYQGKERVMATPLTSGECNACHTEQGAMGAPGRIALPF
jgi:hypothetical protein